MRLGTLLCLVVVVAAAFSQETGDVWFKVGADDQLQLSDDGEEGCSIDEMQDIIIVIDSSTSIARSDFTKQLNFINSLIDKIEIGPEANQVGIISFSDNYRMNFHLNKNRAITKEEKEQLKSEVSAIRQIGGGTNTHKPLEYVKRYMFNSRRGDRPDRRNVCIVITDGQSYEPSKTQAAASALSDDGVLMFALGVGPKVERGELLRIAGADERVFQATSYSELNQVSADFSRSVLGTCPTAQPPVTTVPPPPAAPQLTGMPSGAVSIGTSVTLTCRSDTTDPEASLIWFREGVIVPDTTYRIERNSLVSYLPFTADLAGDGDEFDCVLRHSQYDDQKVSAKVNVMVVPDPPRITYDPSDTVYDGMNVMISCTSRTDDPDNTEVIWLRGGEKLEGDVDVGADSVTNTLTLPVTLSDTADRYECHVLHRNLAAPLVAYGRLTVRDLPGPPAIVSSPEGPVRSGSRVTLTCVSEGTDRDTRVIWYREGSVVGSSYSIEGGVVSNAITVTATTVREYECRVLHPRLPDYLNTFHNLIVYTLPNRPTIKSQGGNVANNQPITLECAATNADVNTELIWVDARGNDIDSSYSLSGSVIKNDHTFATVAETVGTKCSVRNIYLPADLHAFPAPPPTVLPGPPEINDGQAIDKVVAGTAVTLTCKSYGTSRDTRVMWYRVGGDSPVDTSYVIQGDYVVNVLTVELAATQSYQCRVLHPELPQPLTASARVNILEVPDAPRITGISTSPYNIGDIITAVCRSRGTSPDTELVWYVDGRPVDTTYTVTSSGYVENEYRFTVSASATSRPECRLTFPPTGYTGSVFGSYTVRASPDAPVITGTPSTAVSQGSSVELVCTANGASRNARLIWFKDGRQADISYTLRGDVLVNEYSMNVEGSRDVNMTCRLDYPSIGIALSDSTLITVQGDPGKPIITGVPTQPVNPGKVVELECRSLGTSPITKLLWFKNGQELGQRSYTVEGDYVVTRLTHVAELGDTTPIECRLEFQPKNLRISTFANIAIVGMPGLPEIVGTPGEAVTTGSIVRLVCRSYGTSPDTSLVWFRDGQRVDDSYYVTADYVMNVYEFSVSDAGTSNLECKLEFPPMDLEFYTRAAIRGQDPLPSDPIIETLPREPQLPGATLNFTCTSRGTSQATRLVWYIDNEAVDQSYRVEDGRVVNELEITVPTSSRLSLECRLFYPPTGYSSSDYANVSIIALPQEPEIVGAPQGSVSPGDRISLVCRSRGTNPDTRVIWLRDGVTVDTTYAISSGYVINQYDFVAPREDLAKMECRVEFRLTGLELSKIAIINIVDDAPPETPTVDQTPPEVRDGARATLSCRVRHNGKRDMVLTWHQDGNVVDRSHYVEGDYIINKYDIIASTSNQQYECRLQDRTNVITVPYTIKIVDIHVPPPIISGAPNFPLEQGDRFNLTCTWPRLFENAVLVWVDPITKQMAAPTYERHTDSSFVSILETNADPSNTIYECVVMGVTDNNTDTLIDRVKVAVNRPGPEKPVCASGGGQLDFVIILDSSTSITRNNFRKQLDFLSRFVGAFEIGPRNMQVGVVSFSNNDRVDFYMNAHLTKAGLQDAISSIDQIGGGTNTDLPLRRAREEMFTSRFGDRPDVPNVIIILTDGRSYSRDAVEEESRKARQAGVDIYSIGVGVAVDIAELTAISGQRDRVYYAEDFNSLQSIENEFVSATQVSLGPCPTEPSTPQEPTVVGEWSRWSPCSLTCGSGTRTRSRACNQGNDGIDCPSRLRQQEQCFDRVCPAVIATVVGEWSDWSACSVTCGPGTHTRNRACNQGNDGSSCPSELTQQEQCIDKICPPVTGCIPLSHQADIAFLLDTSSSVYEPDFQKMKLFLADLIDLFNVSQSGQRIASATFSDEVRVNFHLDDFTNNRDVKAAFLRIPMHLGGTRTHDALSFARTEIFSEVNGARLNRAKIAFVITDGKSYEPALTTAEAEMARRAGIILYSIGIGPETEQAELERIAGQAKRVYHVDSYDDITQLKKSIGIDLSECVSPLVIDGGYGQWGPYSQCSVTCGMGTRSRSRVCDSPAPRNGGKDCEGPSTRTSRCRLPSCTGPSRPQGWTEWEFSSTCSVTCGQGTQEVSRVCQYEDGCLLGQIESRTVTCQRESCDPATPPGVCGGPNGLNVMFASQGINSNGPNSYFAVDLIANATALISVDGDRVRTSLTLSDCTCGKNTGYDLTRYRNFEDVYNHLHDLDLGDTASLLRKVKLTNNIQPSMSQQFALRDRRKQVLVYMFDANDVITREAISEANKLKLAGVKIYAAVLDSNVDLSLVRQIASQPENTHVQVVSADERSARAYVDSLYRSLCGTQ